MPHPTRVKEERSAPVALTPGRKDRQARYNKVCPSGKSTHRRGWHEGPVSTRVTITTYWSNGNITRAFEDNWTCEHCGEAFVEEWMYA
jgi:hypothetical protein